MTRVLPIRRVSRAWPSTLRILWAPVWSRSSRLSRIAAADLLGEPGRLVERARQSGVLAADGGELLGELGSAMASCQAAVSSSSARTRASGMKRPPQADSPPNQPCSSASHARRSLGRSSAGSTTVMPVTPVIARTAPSGSPSLTRASPTRTASAPSPTNRRTSSTPPTPLSATSDDVVGQQRRELAERRRSTSRVFRLRALTPTRPGPELDGALGLGLVVHLDQRR